MNFTSSFHGSRFSKRIFCIFSLFILFCTYPYVFNLFLPLPSITILMILIIGFVCLLIGIYGIKTKKYLLVIALLQFIAVVVSLMHSHDIEYAKQLLYIIWMLFYILLVKHFIGVKYFLFIYNRILLVVSLLGALSFFLAILGINPLFEYENMDGRTGYFYYFTFTNTRIGNIIRYSGVFDEPGAMAYWGIFALLTNRLYVKDKRLEFPLIVSLLFTFSMAYYIQLFFYFLLFYLREIKLKYIFCIISVFGLLLLLIYQSKDSSFDFYRISLGRFEYDEYAGSLKGNNRYVLVDKAKNVFLNSPIFGIGPTNFYSIDYMADNPYETLAKDGIWGTVFLYLPLLYCFMFGLRSKEVLFASLIISMGYLQRPFHINIQHYTMLYLFMISSYYCYYKRDTDATN